MKRLVYIAIISLSIFIFSSSICAYKEYEIGQKVKYNDIEFYVIKDSNSGSNSVVLLKEEPLTVDEVERYGEGHVNMYVKPYSEYETFDPSSASDQNGYGGMAYYASENCYSYNNSNCKNDYSSSEIKYVIDSWATDKLSNKIKEARLITKDEYILLTDVETYETPTEPDIRYIPRYDWLFNENYWYWTLSTYEDYVYYNWIIDRNGVTNRDYIYNKEGVVRPVVELYKCAIDDSCDNENKDTSIAIDNNINQDSNTNVSVPNTLKSVSGLIILIGLVLVCAGLNIFIIINNKDRKKD